LPRVCLRLLGGFALELDGRAVPVAPSAARLLAFVALADRPVQRQATARALWPSATPRHSTPLLRSALWRLRDAAETLVIADGPALRLEHGAYVDACDAAGRALRVIQGRSGPPADDLRALADAGELLPGWLEDWAVLERERLRQLRLHALEELSAAFIRARRFEAAIEAARAVVAGEPLRESATRRLIEARTAAGDHAGALAEYERFRDLLRDALGTAPSPIMEELVCSVRNR
jgi:DNA-binding SARP family transcriptional activator